MVNQFDRDQIIVDGNEVTYHDVSYLVVEINDKFRPDKLIPHDVILIDIKDEQLISYIIKEVRTHLNPQVYLMPIFIMDTTPNDDLVIHELSDGYLPSINHLDTIEPKTLDILSKIGRLNHPKALDFESQMINRTLNLMFTRGKKVLKPHPYFHSGVGYYYPELSINFNHKDEFKALKILDIAEAEGLFQTHFHERVYLCTSCDGGFLNYREVCPKCGSSDSKHQDLVHHFPCAYVGPMEDFQNTVDDHLDCPKCNKTLRHIGVDYDKPSVLYTCNNCHHRYQDYYTKALCVTCGTENDIEHLATHSIKKYTMTKKGENVAINGYINIEKQLETIAGTVTIEIFKVLLEYELQRLVNEDYKSNIGYLHLERSAEIGGTLGIVKHKELINDLVQMLKSNLNPSDFVSFYNSSTIIYSFVDTDIATAKEKMNEALELSHRMIKKAFQKVTVSMIVNVVPLGRGQNAEDTVNNLINPIGRS